MFSGQIVNPILSCRTSSSWPASPSDCPLLCRGRCWKWCKTSSAPFAEPRNCRAIRKRHFGLCDSVPGCVHWLNNAMHKLALLGGEPVRRHLFPPHNTIGPEEKQAAQEVLDSGNLSQFLGAWSDDFYGGPKVQEFERTWAAHAQTKFAYSVNSNTSGLFAAIGACNLGPGDEVIVSPYTMSASASA